MRVEELPDGRVAKRAEGESERCRLASEAAVLRVAAHPGVVQLVEAGGDALILERVAGPSLGEMAGRSVEEVAGWGAAVATTLADWHAIGCTHGAVRAEHVLFHRDGRPVLCGTGCARVGGDELAVRMRRDVQMLAELIVSRMPPGADARLVRRLKTAGGPARRRPRVRARIRPPDGARELARLLVETVPGARLPTLDKPDATTMPTARLAGCGGSSRVRSRSRVGSRSRVALAAVAVAAAAGLTFDLTQPGGHGSDPVATVHLSTAEGRFSLVTPGADRDVTVIGRWWCGGPTPAVLDPASGAVWVFRQWPGPGGSQAAGLAARLRGVTGLAVLRGSGGCDRLSALTAQGLSRPIDVGSRTGG